MKTVRWMGVLTLALPTFGPAADPAPKPQVPPLISHEDLQNRLSDPNLRLLDATPKAEYEKGHVPGAVWVDGAGHAVRAVRWRGAWGGGWRCGVGRRARADAR